MVHEWGHFITAKKAGLKVEEFGFGFPPRLWSVKKGETVYSLNGIPFGGFVRILGEDGLATDDPRSFAAKRAGVRAKIIVAGVVMNVLLAVFLLTLGNLWGVRIGLSDDLPTGGQVKDKQVQIIQIAPGSPAQQAQLQLLDQILALKAGENRVVVQEIAAVQEFVKNHAGQELTMTIKRGEEILEKSLLARVQPPAGEGALGVSLALTGLVKYPWYQSLYRGVEQTAVLLINTVYGYGLVIKNLLMTGKPGAELSGPVGIARFTGQAARLGLAYLLQLTALLSVNLAVLNIIPFPALDGGRLLLIGLEKIKGAPLPRRTEQWINSLGFTLLILLMIYVTAKDVLKFF